MIIEIIIVIEGFFILRTYESNGKNKNGTNKHHRPITVIIVYKLKRLFSLVHANHKVSNNYRKAKNPKT